MRFGGKMHERIRFEASKKIGNECTVTDVAVNEYMSRIVRHALQGG
jgi:hypothetical protein